MSTNKITNGDYVLSIGPYTGNTWTGTMTINGNLNVSGNVSSITDLSVEDAFITVAANNSGTVTSMGMIAQKTATTWAGLRFNTITSEWEVSPSVDAQGAPVSPYIALSTGGTYGDSNVSTYLNSGTDTGNIVTSGNVSGTTVITTPVALGTLTAVAGARAFINDGNLVASGNFGVQVAGGAGNTTPVWSDGVNWYIG